MSHSVEVDPKFDEELGKLYDEKDEAFATIASEQAKIEKAVKNKLGPKDKITVQEQNDKTRVFRVVKKLYQPLMAVKEAGIISV